MVPAFTRYREAIPSTFWPLPSSRLSEHASDDAVATALQGGSSWWCAVDLFGPPSHSDLSSMWRSWGTIERGAADALRMIVMGWFWEGSTNCCWSRQRIWSVSDYSHCTSSMENWSRSSLPYATDFDAHLPTLSWNYFQHFQRYCMTTFRQYGSLTLFLSPCSSQVKPD